MLDEVELSELNAEKRCPDIGVLDNEDERSSTKSSSCTTWIWSHGCIGRHAVERGIFCRQHYVYVDLRDQAQDGFDENDFIPMINSLFKLLLKRLAKECLFRWVLMNDDTIDTMIEVL